MKRLSFLTPSYYAIFSHDYSYTTKIYYNKINEQELNLEEYNAVAAANSLMLEGKKIDVKNYLSYKLNNAKEAKQDVVLADDLVEAYEFAQESKLNKRNIYKAHLLFSKHLLLPKQRGKQRKTEIVIRNEKAKQIYSSLKPVQIHEYLTRMMNDVDILIKRDMRLNLAFYYASYIHAAFLHISPFLDGNGVIARLLEKWFLSIKLDTKAWFIPSESFYCTNKKSYFENFSQIGDKFHNRDFEKGLGFSMMLPKSIENM